MRATEVNAISQSGEDESWSPLCPQLSHQNHQSQTSATSLNANSRPSPSHSGLITNSQLHNWVTLCCGYTANKHSGRRFRKKRRCLHASTVLHGDAQNALMLRFSDVLLRCDHPHFTLLRVTCCVSLQHYASVSIWFRNRSFRNILGYIVRICTIL